MTNMATRIMVGLVGIPAMLAAVWIGGWLFSAVVVGISTVALWEFYNLSATKHAEANRSVGIAWGVLLQLVVAIGASMDVLVTPAWLLLVGSLVVAGTLVTLAAELWRNLPNAVLNTAITIVGVVYVSLSLSALIFMRAIPEGTLGTSASLLPQGASLVLMTFASVWASDSAAYFVGLAIGKHKMFPRVSPKKSWEGAAGGFAAAVAAFWGLASVLAPAMPWPHAVAAGVIVGIVGPIGDLAESLLKRDAEIKDSSHIIPGHGGFLDRFDSMLFVAPLVMIYIMVSQAYAWPAIRLGW